MISVGEQQASSGRLLIPVGESVTMRKTVAHAVGVALESGGHSEIHLVAPIVPRGVVDTSDVEMLTDAESRLERAAAWVREDADEGSITVQTSLVGTDAYLFSPNDFADVIGDYAKTNGIGRVIVDPEYAPAGNVTLLEPLEVALAERGLDVEEAPVAREVRRGLLEIGSGSLLQFGTLFGISFLFYQLLGGFVIVTGDRFDLFYELITGMIAAGIVAGALSKVSFSRTPDIPRLLKQGGRLAIYTPYLLAEIIKSNILITYIILHPRLPIDPRLTRVRSAVWGGPAVMTLANSITLTPGTLTIDTDGHEFYVHSLFGSAREGLFDGGLERGTRFVFYGRKSMAIPTPEERGDAELLGPKDAEDESAETASTDDTATDTEDSE
ncbi:MAG: monovalent cation/H+ antiporter subunit E [Natronomonas sp.]